MEINQYKLSHLKQLEAESIHIIREVAAEFENPVMLYSVGKDSSVMLHLAHKAFLPGKIPFSLMHVDTQWKFQEMYAFRSLMAKKYDVDIISLMLHLEEHEGMRKRVEQKREFTVSEINFINGIQKIKDLSYGIIIMQK